MAIQTKTILKDYFNEGDRPTEANFADLIESFTQAPKLLDCSSNPDYPASVTGDTYKVSVAGKVGGASGINVLAGDIIFATESDSTGGNQATVGSKWTIIGNKATGGGGLPSLTDGSVTYWGGGTLVQDNANFNYASNLLRLQGSAAGDFNPLAIRNNGTATLSNSASVSFWGNRTTGGMTNLGGIRGIITNIGNTTYASAVSLFATPTNGSPLEVLRAVSMASAVNYLAVSNSATATALSVSASGSDTNIGLSVNAKGSGSIFLNTSGNVFAGGTTTPTAKIDITAAIASAASLRIRQTATAPTSPNVGDFWLESTNNRVKHRKNGSTTTDALFVHDNYDMLGTGNRMVQTDSLGNMAAFDEIVELMTSDPTTQSNLSNTSNWNGSGVYTGPSIVGAYQGLMYYNATHWFFFVNTTTPIRLARI